MKKIPKELQHHIELVEVKDCMKLHIKTKVTTTTETEYSIVLDNSKK